MMTRERGVIPKEQLARVFGTPFFRFPTLWEDFEREMTGYGWDQSGLTVSEDAGWFYIEAQMPGLDAAHIQVTFDKGVLTIRGDKEEREDNKERKYHRKANYSYYYQVAVPGNLEEGKTDATYHQGVMEIKIPKLQESKSKRIDVKTKN